METKLSLQTRRRSYDHEDAIFPKLKFGKREKRRRVRADDDLVDVLAVLAELHAEDLAEGDRLDVADTNSRELLELLPVGLRGTDVVARDASTPM